MNAKERYSGFDWLRIIAAFGIIGCHLALPNMTEGAMFLKRYTDLNVGVFAAIAGFFTAHSLQRNPSVGKFIKHRVLKLLVPLYLWSVFYIGIDICFDYISHKPLTFQPASLKYWNSVVICGRAATQTWFLASLFYAQLILFYPIKNNFFSKSRWADAGLLMLAIIGITVASDGGYWRYYFLRLISFFLLGVVMFREKELLQKIPLSIVYVLMITGVLIIASGFRYGFIGECVLSFPMLLWGLLWSSKSEAVCNYGELLGRLSFGVYLVHALFCRAFCVVLQRIGWPSNAYVYLLDLILVGLVSLLFSCVVFRLSLRFKKIAFIMPS